MDFATVYASTSALFTAWVGNVTQIVLTVLGVALGVSAALFGLYFGLKKLRRSIH